MKCFKGFQKGVNLGGWISQFAKYDHEHFRSFIQKEDIAYIASLETGFGYLRSCFAWCREYGLNLLIDLHECYGYSFDPLKKDMDRSRFFYDEALQERFLNLWKKIADQPGNWRHNWRQLHLIMWEEAHGPIPKGHLVIFKDGNRQNCVLENMALITQAENAVMNKQGLRYETAEHTETGILIAKIKIAARKRKKRKKEA